MKKVFGVLTAIVLFSTVLVPAVGAKAPDTFVQENVDMVLEIIDDTGWEKAEKADTLQRRLVQSLRDVFTFRQMTFRALGPYARQISDSQVKTIVPLFTRLLQNVYIERLTSNLSSSSDDYEIEKIKVDRAETRGDGRYAKVYTVARIIRGGEKSTAQLNYKLMQLKAGWRVYDVEIEDVSLVQNYRQQFSNILANNSFDYLIEELRKKLEEKQ